MPMAPSPKSYAADPFTQTGVRTRSVCSHVVMTPHFCEFLISDDDEIMAVKSYNSATHTRIKPRRPKNVFQLKDDKDGGRGYESILMSI